MRSPAALLAASVGIVGGLLAIGLVLPNWLLFLLTLAAAQGVVSLGIVLLMRGGVVSFGQGLVFAVGGYAVALAFNRLGLTEAPLLILLAALAAGLVGAAAGPLLSRYSGIFFGMLTLALSMVLYGVLLKSTALGGSDGFNIPRPSLFGRRLDGAGGDYALYALTITVTGAVSFLAALYIRSVRGLMSLAIQANALRVDYLGASARAVTTVNFILAALLGGIGGALTVLALGHIEPDFAYWTRSGEFVFVAILAGPQSVAAVFVASLVLELVRSFSNLYFPNTWQLALGLFLLVVILFLPRGIGSLWSGRASPRAAASTVLETREAPAE